MSGWLVANLAGTAVMVGFIWTIQVLTYPMMQVVPAEGFVAYELSHRNRVTALLAVLAPTEIISAAGVVLFVDDVPSWLAIGSAGLLFAIWLSTLLFYAPLHMRLSDGFDPVVHRRSGTHQLDPNCGMDTPRCCGDRHDRRRDLTGSVDSMTTPNRDVDAVIFDFAGVLSTSPGEMMRRQIDESGIDVEVDIATFVHIIMGPLDAEGDHPWHQLERGRIDFDEYLAGIEPLWRAAGFEAFPTPPRGDAVVTGMSKIPEMIDAATAVRTAGYRTAILTNNIKEWGAWRHALGRRQPRRRRRRLV